MTHIWAKMPYLNYRVSGADAKTFLQGQLTQDIKTITDSQCHYGAYCNPQGRMFANFLLSAQGEDVIIRLHQEQADTIINRLKMFTLRSDVSIELIRDYSIGLNQAVATELCSAIGVALPETFSSMSQDVFQLMALPNGYYELRTRDMAILSLLQFEFSEDFDGIETLRIGGGNFHILPEVRELVQPQQTPLENWGGISYTKGCYVGQEIIARAKYRGKVRKGFAVATLDGKPDIAIGEKVIADDFKTGTVIEYHQGDKQSICLALMLLEDIENTCQINGHKAKFTLIKA